MSSSRPQEMVIDLEIALSSLRLCLRIRLILNPGLGGLGGEIGNLAFSRCDTCAVQSR